MRGRAFRLRLNEDFGFSGRVTYKEFRYDVSIYMVCWQLWDQSVLCPFIDQYPMLKIEYTKTKGTK